jgi:membrane-associated phospholipid phosphatase
MQLDFLLKLQEISTPFLNSFFSNITNLGHELFYTIIITIIFWCCSKSHGIRLAIAVTLNLIINTDVKEFFKADRPFIMDDRIKPLYIESAPGYSLPSGHTQVASSFWFYTSMMIRKKWYSILAIVATLIVGFSRLYLKLHWPIDVLVGLVLGVVIVWILEMIFRKLKQPIYSLWLTILYAFVVPIVLVGLSGFEEGAVKVGTLLSGLLFGYFIESKYIGFKEDATIVKQVVKVVLGIAGVIIIRSLIKTILPETLVVDGIRYFVMGMWITFIAPWIFVKFKLAEKNIDSMF